MERDELVNEKYETLGAFLKRRREARCLLLEDVSKELGPASADRLAEIEEGCLHPEGFEKSQIQWILGITEGEWKDHDESRAAKLLETLVRMFPEFGLVFGRVFDDIFRRKLKPEEVDRIWEAGAGRVFRIEIESKEENEL